MLEILKDILIDTTVDTLKLLPFLLVAFLLIEVLTARSSAMTERILTNINKSGPIVGSILGCIPQCGFSAIASELFSGGMISLGTLLAVFLATSDEAIIILLGYPNQLGNIVRLVLTKLIIGILAGYIVDLTLSKKITSTKKIADHYEDCDCHDHGILYTALGHAFKLAIFIFIITAIIDLLITLVGMDKISSLLLADTLFQPFLTALIGLIPNCAASVLLTELYISGAISFAAATSGLCANAGLGLLVLFKVNKSTKENYTVVGIMYIIAVASGIILSL